MAAKKVNIVGSEKVRFVIVGCINTAVDFTVLFSLVNIFRLSPLIANIFSTSVALCVSYLLNKRSVFADTGKHNSRQVLRFVVVTLVGIWVVQNIVIFFVSGWLRPFVAANIALFIAKVIASLFSLTWNYLWYSRLVFRQQKPSDK